MRRFSKIMQLVGLLVVLCPLALAKKGHRSPKLRQSDNNQPLLTQSRISMVNTDSPAHVVSENFISLTLDPYMIRDLPWADPQTLMLARELSPAWFKIAPTTESLEYGDFNLTMFQWASITHFANESGMNQLWDVGIFARAAETWKQSMRGDELEEDAAAPGTVHDFPPSPQHMGFVATEADLDKIASIIDVFPRYNSKSLQLFGPEVGFFNNYNEIEKFSSWLGENVDKVTAVTFRPSPQVGGPNVSLSSSLTTEAGELFKLELMVLHGTLEQIAQESKPIFISDSRLKWHDLATTQRFKNTFGLTLLWADRLGLAASNGVSAIFQPNLLPLHDRGLRNQPSTDFWFAMLHKKLAGTRVLSVRSRSLEHSKSSFYSHCTPVGGKENYPPGAVTVIGINLGDVELRGNVSDGSDDKSETIIHEFLLTGNITDNKMFLNGMELKSDFDKNPIPSMSPKVLKTPKILVLPPQSITFWVFPFVNAAACLDKPVTRSKKKRSILDEDPDTTHLAIVFPVEDVVEAENDLAALAEGAPTTKEKRCHRLRQTGNEEPCPEGCKPTGPLGGCGLRGLKIMAPGCSTADVLERLVYITKQRRSGCCCDGSGPCGTESQERENGTEDEKPVVEATTVDALATTSQLGGRIGGEDDIEKLIKTVFTSPQPPETTTTFNPGAKSAPEGSFGYTIQPVVSPGPEIGSSGPISYMPPVEISTPPLTSSSPSVEITTLPSTSPSQTTSSVNYSLPFTSSSTPMSSAAPSILTTTPVVDINSNKRIDGSEGTPVVEKTQAPPYSSISFGQKPFRFEGQFNGVIRPYDQSQPAETNAFNPGQSNIYYVPVAYPLQPLNDPDAVKERHEQYLSNFQNAPLPETEHLRQSFYYPAEVDMYNSKPPCQRCAEGCKLSPDLEEELKFLSENGESASEEELINSQQVLEVIQEKVESEEVYGTRHTETEGGCQEGCVKINDCMELMSSKIRTALDVINWLKEASKGKQSINENLAQK